MVTIYIIRIATNVAPGGANITAALSGLISLPVTIAVLFFVPIGVTTPTVTASTAKSMAP